MNNSKNNIISMNKAKSPISLSNSISYNLEKRRAFNNSFGIPFKFSFTNYKSKEEKLKEKCWNSLTNFIISNYNSKKATKIANFGEFTCVNSISTIKSSLYLSQNKFIKDIPIFLISDNFISYIKPGIYDDKNGLTQISNKKYIINKNIEKIDVNFIKMSKEVNIKKELCEKIIQDIIDDIKEKIEMQIFNAKKMEGLGAFLLRGNIFGMRFENAHKCIYNFFPNKICLKKNCFKLNKFKKEYENNKNRELFALTEYNSDLLTKSSSINPKNIKLKIKDNNNNKIITKDNLINYFLNIDNSLDYETVNKIINIYNSDNNIEVELNGIIIKLLPYFS